jgi:hypothetical protein
MMTDTVAVSSTSSLFADSFGFFVIDKWEGFSETD